MNLVSAILPIILVIATGWLSVALRLLPREGWGAIETLSFRLLIPAILIREIATADLSVARYAPLVGGLIACLALAGAAVLTLRRFLPESALSNGALSTLFQTTTRWNAFVALAAIDQFAGPQGLLLVAVSMAVLIPLINIVNIVVMAAFGTARTSPGAVLRMVLKNPLVLGCLIGIGLNLSRVPLPGPLTETLDMIGRAALGVGLLAVGAGISLRRLLGGSGWLWLGLLLRPILLPLLFLAVSGVLKVPDEQLLTGMFILAVPAAANGYIVARQMGGDADLYADILAWQTLATLFILPFLVWLAMS